MSTTAAPERRQNKRRQDGGQNGARGRKSLLVFTTGTFCDGTLSEAVLDAVKEYDITYVTDERIPPRTPVANGGKSGAAAPYRRVITYATPSFIFTDPALGASDPQQNPLAWGVAHPVMARQTYDWVMMLGDRMEELERKLRPDAVLLHFSLLPALMWAERRRAQKPTTKCSALDSLVATTPHIVLYFYPGVPNSTAPWLFDSRMRRPTFRLYDPKYTCQVRKSWETMMGRMSMRDGTASSVSDEDVRAFASSLRDMHHALLWDPAIVPPLTTLVPGLDAHMIGSLGRNNNDGQQAKKTEGVPPSLLRFLRKWQGVKTNSKPSGSGGGGVAFITFGTFGGVAKLRSTAELLARQLRDKMRMAVILHDTTKQSEQSGDADYDYGKEDNKKIIVHRGHVPYDAVVPYLSLVAFTGSMCLQLTCLRNGVPMLFVPLLTEQYFWAKNYQHFTGVPYIDVEEKRDRSRLSDIIITTPSSPLETVPQQIAAALRTLKTDRTRREVRLYLDRVRNSMASRDSHKELQSMVARVNAAREKKEVRSGFLLS